MWVEGEILAKYFSPIPCKFYRVSFDTERLNGKRRKELQKLNKKC